MGGEGGGRRREGEGRGSDHMNQLGTSWCSECNPNDYENW